MLFLEIAAAITAAITVLALATRFGERFPHVNLAYRREKK